MGKREQVEWGNQGNNKEVIKATRRVARYKWNGDQGQKKDD